MESTHGQLCAWLADPPLRLPLPTQAALPRPQIPVPPLPAHLQLPDLRHLLLAQTTRLAAHRLLGHRQRHGQPSDRPHLPLRPLDRQPPARPPGPSLPNLPATLRPPSVTPRGHRHRRPGQLRVLASTTPSNTSSPWTTTPASSCTSPTLRCAVAAG